jgi:hypothetical protein
MGVGIDDVDARLERAKENIANLASEIKELLQDGCDERAIPARFTALAGESIYLMRSALDHLAWHLVVAAGSEPGRARPFRSLPSILPAMQNRSSHTPHASPA